MKPVLLVRNAEHESFGLAPGALAWARGPELFRRFAEVAKEHGG